MAWVIFTKTISGKQPATRLGTPDPYWFTQTSAGRYDDGSAGGKDGTTPFTINVNESAFSETIDGLTFTTQWSSSREVWINVGNSTYGGVTTNGGINVNIGFFVNDELQQARFAQIVDWSGSAGSRSSYLGAQSVQQQKNLYQWVQRNADPEYTLRSLDKVVGTDATLWLSSIKDEYTNAGDPVIDVPIDYMRSRDPRSLIFDLGLGSSPKLLCTTNDTETEKTELLLSWTGDDYTLIGKTTNKISGQTTTQINIPLGIITNNDYLGILVDYEQEVATITVINITPSSLQIAYNYEETKSFLQTATQAHIFYTMLMGGADPTEEDPNDPYPDNPSNRHGGGSGDRDYTSDPVANTPLPSSIACNLGFITLFSPSESQLKQLASYMWTDSLFDIDNFKKLFADPMDCILNLSKYPVTVTTSGSKPVVVGNMSTNVNMYTVSNEFVDEPKGTAKIAQQLNSFLDYSPHTQLEIYLPFCGRHHVNVDLYVNRKKIALSYRINVLTGGCIATLADANTGDVLDQFSGNCAYSIPFTSTNYQNALNSLVQAGAGIASGYVGSVMGINPKATIESRVGNIGSVGAVSSLQPYFIFTCPRLVTPADANKIQGQPAYTTHTIGSLSGFVKVRSIDLSSATATEGELNEIESILKGGAYI